MMQIGDRPILDVAFGDVKPLFVALGSEVQWHPDVPDGYSYGFLVQSGADGLGGSLSGSYGLMKPSPTPKLVQLTVLDSGGVVVLRNEDGAQYHDVVDMGVEFEGHPKVIVTWNGAKGQYEGLDPTLWTYFDSIPNAWIGVLYTNEDGGGPVLPPHDISLNGWFDSSDVASLTLGAGDEVLSWANKINPGGTELTAPTNADTGPVYQASVAELGGKSGLRFDNLNNAATSGLLYAPQDLISDNCFFVMYLPETISRTANNSFHSVVAVPETGLNRSGLPLINANGQWRGYSSLINVNGVPSQLDIAPEPSGLVVVDSYQVSRYLKTVGFSGPNSEPPPATSEGGDSGINGWICEILYYGVKLDATQAEDARQYLYTKWGIVP